MFICETHKWDIIISAEMRLLNSISHLYSLLGYKLFLKQCQLSSGGNICVYVKEVYEADIIPTVYNIKCFEH